MKSSYKKENGTMTVSLDGRLDSTNAQAFNEELGNKMTDGLNIIFDFKDLSYISSAGLRVIFSWQKKASDTGNSIKVVNVCNDVYEILNVTGFTDIFKVERV